jgi:CheY-like chemotaxis protein
MGEKLLNKLGYRVTISTSSIDALEIFRQRPHEFDIVISDQTMPRMTGLQMTAEIRKIKPGFPVILCTGFSETINEENFRSHGIDGFIMKPLLLRDFAHIIRSVLDGKKEK